MNQEGINTLLERFREDDSRTINIGTFQVCVGGVLFLIAFLPLVYLTVEVLFSPGVELDKNYFIKIPLPFVFSLLFGLNLKYVIKKSIANKAIKRFGQRTTAILTRSKRTMISMRKQTGGTKSIKYVFHFRTQKGQEFQTDMINVPKELAKEQVLDAMIGWEADVVCLPQNDSVYHIYMSSLRPSSQGTA